MVKACTFGKFQDYGNIHGVDSFKITLKNSADVSFYFYLQLYKTIIEWLLSYDVTLIRKCKKVVPEEVPEK